MVPRRGSLDATTLSNPRRSPGARSLLRAQRSEAGTNFLAEQLWLLPGGKMPAFVELVVVDQVGVRALRPRARAEIDLVREAAHSNRDGHPFRGKVRELVFPVETRSRNCRVRQPCDRDVVEDIISCQAFGRSGEHA